MANKIRYHRVTLEECNGIHEVAIVIDVLRAFSTACYAFAAGAKRIVLTDTVENALDLQTRLHGSLLMGEVDGLPIPGFNFSNSPAELIGVDLSGTTLIHRTSAGTQGVVRSAGAEVLLVASYCCAEATVAFVRSLSPSDVTFVVTGGEEDVACADYMEELLESGTPSRYAHVERIRWSTHGLRFLDSLQPDFPEKDIELCSRLNWFPSPLKVVRVDDLLVIERPDAVSSKIDSKV